MTNQDVMELCHIFSHRVDYWVEQEFHRFVTELSVDWDLCLEGCFLHFRSQLKRHTSHSKYLNISYSILNYLRFKIIGLLQIATLTFIFCNKIDNPFKSRYHFNLIIFWQIFIAFATQWNVIVPFHGCIPSWSSTHPRDASRSLDNTKRN